MKTMRNIFTILLACILLTACHTKDQKYTIGISQCADGFWRWQMNEEMFREAILNSDVSYTLLISNDDSQQQIADIERLMAEGVDALIVSPNNSKDLVPVIEKAYDSGIPVILVDRKIESNKYTAFIGANNREVGQMAAQYILSMKGTGVRIAEFKGDIGITPVQERHEGFASTLQKAGVQFESFNCGWDQESAFALFDSLKKAGNIPDVIFCHNDNLTQGIRHAIKEHGTMLIGVDGLAVEGAQMIINNELTASVSYPTCGNQAMRAAINALHGKQIERAMNVQPRIVDINNAQTIQAENQRAAELADNIHKLSNRLDDFLMRYNMQQLLLTTSLIFIALLVVLLIIVFRAYSTNKRLRLRIEKMANARIGFFTNVSHDFRTPLTLIADPLRQLRSSLTLDSYSEGLLDIANKNVTVLLRLINQVMDFRKFEEGKMHMELSEFNLREKMNEWTRIFSPLAEKRNISYGVTCPASITMIADGEKIERLTYNILSNAFKYTPDGGHISVDVTPEGTDNISIAFTDSGKGMSEKELSHVFEDFYQANVHYSGTGIGLALVKAFVDMHHGKINVESAPGKGTTFTVCLPLRQKGEVRDNIQRSQVIDNLQEGALLAAKTDIQTEQNAEENLPSILIIDDSDDVRSYVRLQLQHDYSILEAPDAEKGIAIAREQVPDIIILDYMMPGMDGVEAASILKSDLSTSHIPILMLTADIADETQIRSYDSGVEAYMQKPFNTQVLCSRLSNLIIANQKRQQQLADTIANQGDDANTNNGLSKMDSQFIDKLNKYFRAHLSESELRVEDLCTEFALSHTQIYRKTKSLIGIGPNELLRLVRLERSKELLHDTDLSIADITYDVGFTSPSYFAKCFRKQYGITPSEYREGKMEE